MPVTATAKRALRVSTRKALVNTIIISKLEAAIRQAKRNKTAVAVQKATSLADRAAKSKVIHKNKAARIKSSLSKLVKPATKVKTKKASKKTTKK